MKRTTTKTALISAVVLSSAFVAQSASAALITSFNYNVQSSFSNVTGTGGDGDITTSGSGFNDDPTKISWGVSNSVTPTPFEQSSVSITGSVPGNVTTDGTPADGATFTHDNNVVADTSNTLDRFNLNTKLNLDPATPPSEADAAEPNIPALTFSSFFTETDNVEPCTEGAGSVCDDIFVLANADDTALAGVGTPQSFTIDGYRYDVMLALEGLRDLNADECAAAGAASGCFGLTTLENGVNNFNTTFSITARAVPEPGTLAMLSLGLGLLGLGFFVRRRDEDPMA